MKRKHQTTKDLFQNRAATVRERSFSDSFVGYETALNTPRPWNRATGTRSAGAFPDTTSRHASLSLLFTMLLAGTIMAADKLPQSYLLDRLPAGAVEVAQAMKSAKVGQEIVLRGRITDGDDVFVPNRAIFRLADESAVPPSCAPGKQAQESGGACAVPADKRATIQFVNERGELLPIGLKGLHGLSIGKEVFVVGRVHQADNDKVLIVNVAKLHVPEGNVPFGLFLNQEPNGVKPITATKSNAKSGDTITIRGRVGGSLRPFIDGRAVFTIVGDGPRACSDTADDHCATPWDYCCVPPREILKHAATIQIVDDNGAPVRTDIKGRRGITELSELTIVGTVVAAKNDAMVVNASGIYVHDHPEN
jgi:hypothetical protein